MSVTNQTNKVYGAGNGVTVTFSFSFKIFAASELLVYKINDSTGVATLQVLTTDYTVSISSVSEGGTVTFVVAPAVGETYFIKRVVPYTQSAEIPSEGNLPGPQLENQLDLMTMMVIQINETVGRALSFPPTFTGTIPTLPTPQDGYAIGWDGTDGTLQNILVDTAVIEAAVAAAAASASAAASSASAASTSASAAATSASSASTSASNAAASAAAAAAALAAAGLPGSLSGAATKLLQVKSDETGYQFIDPGAFNTVLAMNGKIFKTTKGADVASAAGTITLGDDGNYFDITGTAAITGITAKTAGAVVILQFDSTASLVDGSNLKLQGNFQGAAEAQIALVSDGTNWFEICRNISRTIPTNIQVFTSSGTWTKPANISQVHVKVWGGGAGGNNPGSNASGGGGGGGGYSEGLVTVTTDVTVTVGAGGAAGGSGGTSSFAGSTTPTGAGGSVGTTVTGGAGGGGSNGTINLPGANGQNGVNNDGGSGGAGGGSPMGGSGGGGGGTTLGANPSQPGGAGCIPGGGGGGGSEPGGTSGAGGNGLVIVMY